MCGDERGVNVCFHLLSFDTPVRQLKIIGSALTVGHFASPHHIVIPAVRFFFFFRDKHLCTCKDISKLREIQASVTATLWETFTNQPAEGAQGIPFSVAAQWTSGTSRRNSVVIIKSAPLNFSGKHLRVPNSLGQN